MSEFSYKLRVETTDHDFKKELETKKAKSWLKTVSAFSNVNGGILYFGIDDDGTVVGMENPQWAIEKISEIINGRIDPKPAIHVTSEVIEGKAVVVLNVEKGHATPYYYFNGNKREAFLRIGNESVPVTSEQLN